MFIKFKTNRIFMWLNAINLYFFTFRFFQNKILKEIVVILKIFIKRKSFYTSLLCSFQMNEVNTCDAYIILQKNKRTNATSLANIEANT